MITEDYVSFEIAKLLKEKGFNESCYAYYDDIDDTINRFDKGYNFNNTSYPWGVPYDVNKAKKYIVAPTLQMAMKWLREVYNILIVVDYEWECDTTPYYFKIYRLGENGKPERVAVKGVLYDKEDNPTEHIVGYRDWERSRGDYSTYEQAYEAAIKYCLENLI